MEGGSSCFSDALNSFTPVQRRASSVNIRRLHGDPEKDWTAARCHRLLRALTSRVAILRRDISRCSSSVTGQSIDSAVEVKIPPIRKVENTQIFEDDWTQPRKRIRRTYSGRNAKGAAMERSGTLPPLKGRPPLAPGEVSVPTPVLARVRGDYALEQCTAAHGSAIRNIRSNQRQRTQDRLNDRDRNSQLRESLREMRTRLQANHFSIYEGIYNGLETLLKATVSDESGTNPNNQRSLMSMCLRSVPLYIEQEELLLAAHLEETGRKSAIDPRDVSAEIYDELENFGSCGHGWKQLRIIVRSHGIHVVSHAIQAGLLDTEFCGSMVKLCLQNSAETEAEILLSALLSLDIPGPKNVNSRFDDSPATRPLSTLWNFVEYSGRCNYQYRQLSAMISNGILSIGWLATKEFSTVWTTVLQALCPGSDNSDALMFLHTSLPRLGGMSHEGANAALPESELYFALKNTFSSLLTTLSSILILSKEICIQSEICDPGYRQIFNLLRSCLLQYELCQNNAVGGCLLLASNLIVGSLNGCADINLPIAVSLLHQVREGSNDSNSVSDRYNDFVMFVCFVARCCGRGASSSGFEHLKILHHLLDAQGASTSGGDIFHEVVIDSAFAFAQQVPGWQHVEYATCISSKIHPRNTIDRTSLSSSASDDCKTGFRWEEGIGEWVTATPMVGVKRESIEMLPATDESVCDNLHRPPPALRRTVDKKTPLKTETPILQSLYESGSEIEAELSANSPGSEPSPIDESFLSRDEGLPSHLEDSNINENSASNISSFQRGHPYMDINTSFVSDVASTSFDSKTSARFRRSILTAPRVNKNVGRNNRDWPLFDESQISDSELSQQSKSPNGRQFIDRAPRMGGRTLRSSQAWRVFDESDDELSTLSFYSVSNEGDQVLQEVTKKAGRSSYPVRPAKHVSKQTRSAISPFTDSEDELCL